jgi:hypothetical protein
MKTQNQLQLDSAVPQMDDKQRLDYGLSHVNMYFLHIYIRCLGVCVQVRKLRFILICVFKYILFSCLIISYKMFMNYQNIIWVNMVKCLHCAK